MKNALNNARSQERFVPLFPNQIFRFAAIIIVIVAAAVAAAAKQFFQFFRPICDLALLFGWPRLRRERKPWPWLTGPHPLRVLEESGDEARQRQRYPLRAPVVMPGTAKTVGVGG